MDLETRKEDGRIDSVDIAKGIGILCVVLGHLPLHHDIVLLKWLVYPFHMPLFFFVAGMFLSFRTTLAEFVRDKAKRLLCPYLLLGLGSVCLYSLTHANAGCVTARLLGLAYGCAWGQNRLSLGFVPEAGIIWFLEALFIALVEVRICYRFRYGFLLVIAGACVGRLLSRWGLPFLPFNIQSGLFAALYVYTGKFMAERKCLPPGFWLGCIGAVAYSICIHQRWIVVLASASFSNWLMPVLSVFCVLFVLKTAQLLAGAKIVGGGGLREIGRSSLIVFGFHHLYLAGGLVEWVLRMTKDLPVLSIIVEVVFPFAATVLWVRVRRRFVGELAVRRSR